MEEEIERIIGKIYSTVLDEKAWPELIADIAHHTDAVAGFYAGLDTRRGNGAYWYAHGHDARVQAVYNEHFLSLDPTLAHVITAPGNAFSCVDYVPAEEVANNPFYTHFMIPNGLRYVLSGVVSMRGSMVSFFGFQRRVDQSPFGKRETAFMQRLIPHFQKVDELIAKVSEISEAKRMTMAFVNRLEYGVVFVDQLGQIRLTNQHAEKWLESGNAVKAIFGRLIMNNANDQIRLSQLIKASTRPENEAQGGALVTEETPGGNQARIVVLPVGRDEQSHIEDWETKAVVVIADVAQQRAMAPQVLQDTYGLSAAELRVALGLVAGQTPEALSDNLCVSMNTIRAHTKHIYEKTGLHRQVELVRLVFGLPAMA